MGANSTQALAVAVFLVAFVFLGAALAAGGNLMLLLAALAALLASATIFLKAKRWEEDEG